MSAQPLAGAVSAGASNAVGRLAEPDTRDVPARAGAAAGEVRALCYHCAEPVPLDERRTFAFDGAERALCCGGCEAVMSAIVEAGLGDYYRKRIAPAAFGTVPPDIAHALDELAVYDEPEFVERHVVPVDAAGRESGAEAAVAGELTLALDGLRCGACVWLVERTLTARSGVFEASCNFSTSRVRVRFDPARTTPSTLLGALAGIGYRALPFDARERERALTRTSRDLLQRLFVAGIASMQVMMYALPAYLSGPGGVEFEYERLLRWASLVLTVPVVLYSARPFFAGAWRSLLARRPNMDVPVSIGLGAAFAASVHATLTMRGEIWFDSVAMFAFLLLGARWLEWQARRRALRAVDDLGVATPDIATRLETGGARRVPAARLAPGERILVAGGERVPADARVAADSGGMVDLSLLSGESMPARRDCSRSPKRLSSLCRMSSEGLSPPEASPSAWVERARSTSRRSSFSSISCNSERYSFSTGWKPRLSTNKYTSATAATSSSIRSRNCRASTRSDNRL